MLPHPHGRSAFSTPGGGQKWPSSRRPIDSVQSGCCTSVSTSPVHHNLQTFITNFCTEDRSPATLPQALNCEVKELVDERDCAENQVCFNHARRSGVDSGHGPSALFSSILPPRHTCRWEHFYYYRTPLTIHAISQVASALESFLSAHRARSARTISAAKILRNSRA